MNSKSYVVMGEARESDSEEEINSSSGLASDLMENSKGKIVFGEAPESDEESCVNIASMESVSSAMSALSAPATNKNKKTYKNHQSILVKKLYERNASLYKNLIEFIEGTSSNAGNDLNAANKRLLKCQLQLQEGANYLRIINSSLTALDSNLQILLSTNYLPNIKINESVEQEQKSKPP